MCIVSGIFRYHGGVAEPLTRTSGSRGVINHAPYLAGALTAIMLKV